MQTGFVEGTAAIAFAAASTNEDIPVPAVPDLNAHQA
jgi:hypothetical protein